MEHKIIHSILEVTRARDTDSLEINLLTMLAELMPVEHIALIRLIDEFRFDTCRQTLAATISREADGTAIDWDENVRDVVPSDAFLDATNEGAITFDKEHERITVFVPVPGEGRPECMLVLHSRHETVMVQNRLLEGIAGIYSNFLRVLEDSQRDKLTGLLNRRTFDKRLTRMMQLQREASSDDKPRDDRRHRGGSSAWLAIIDIDLFKKVNDSYGHIYGDEVILNLGQQMKSFFRNTDLLFRFGGEEFLVVLEPMDAEQAWRALERFRAAVEAKVFPQIGTITVSIGFAGISADDYAPVVLDRADKALYFAKRNGRNRVAQYEPLVASGDIKATEMRGAIDLF